MSVVREADYPSLGVIQGTPSVVGLYNSSCTPELKGTARSAVTGQTLNSTKECVEVLSSEDKLQGAIFPLDGVNKGYAEIAQFKNKSQYAQSTNMATPTLQAQFTGHQITGHQFTGHQDIQCRVNNDKLTDIHSAQTSVNFSTENILQSIGLYHQPKTAEYSHSLPTSKPISPLKWNSSSGNNQITANDSRFSVGENVVLEIPIEKSGKNLEIAINSVLTFTSKCINDQLKSEQIVKLLCDFYHGNILKTAYQFCRSLLEKKHKPKRINANYESSGSIKIVTMCRQIVKLVKLLLKSKNIMLASRDLNVPLIYTKNKESMDPVEKSKISDISESKLKNVVSKEEKKSHLDNKINVENERNQTNCEVIDSSLTCTTKINSVPNNVNSDCSTLANSCFTKHCNASNTNYANDDLVSTADIRSGELTENNNSEVLCTLKAILEQLQIMNKSTSQISVISETMEKLLKDNKSISVDPDSKGVLSTLNWTSEKNKWMTPPNAPREQIPIHSTPVQREKNRSDLHQIINDTTETNSVVKPTDLSLSFESTANAVSAKQLSYPLEPEIIIIPLPLEPKPHASNKGNQETVNSFGIREPEITTITPVVDSNPKNPSIGIMGLVLVKFLAAVIVSNVMRLQKNPKESMGVTEFPVDEKIVKKDQEVQKNKRSENYNQNKVTEFPVDDEIVNKDQSIQKDDHNKNSVKNVVKGLKHVATSVKKALDNKKGEKSVKKICHDNNKKMNYVGAAKKGTKASQISKNADKTFDSHPNMSSACVKRKQGVDSNSLYSTIDSDEGDWEKLPKKDGPLIFTDNPHKKYVEKENKAIEKSEKLPPQRHWDKEIPRKEQNYMVQNNFPAQSQPVCHSAQTNFKTPQLDQRQEKQKPDNITESSCQIVSSGQDGKLTSDIEVKSVYHDGFQVFHSRKVKKRQRVERMEKLNNRNNNRGIQSAFGKIKTRFVLTKVHPDTEEEDVETDLLNWFEDFEEVYVRKSPMNNHAHYATFVFIATSENQIDPEMVENANWPEGVRCFFAPNGRNRRY